MTKGMSGDLIEGENEVKWMRAFQGVIGQVKCF